MSAAWLDYDGDGRPDLLVSNMWSSCGQRIVNDPAFGPAKKDPSLREAYRRHVKGNSLYHNNGDGTIHLHRRFPRHRDRSVVMVVRRFRFRQRWKPGDLHRLRHAEQRRPTDLMSYFYRQVVAKSPVTYRPAPEYENGWNAINQLIRQDYSLGGARAAICFSRGGQDATTISPA